MKYNPTSARDRIIHELLGRVLYGRILAGLGSWAEVIENMGLNSQ